MKLHSFSRTELLIGKEGLNKLYEKRIAIFGIGGVGSFVAEGLIRAGIGKFVLVDDDDICLTNINRQLHALRSTVDRSKVEVMKERMLDINPRAEVLTYKMLYTAETSEELLSDSYDYVVDAIDMVSSKLDLIERCHRKGIPIISSMGTGNKLNPTEFQVVDIFDTSMCPLAKVMRKELRKRGIDKLRVVYSKEAPIKPIEMKSNYERARQVPGSISFVPSVAGLIIASEVVKALLE